MCRRPPPARSFPNGRYAADSTITGTVRNGGSGSILPTRRRPCERPLAALSRRPPRSRRRTVCPPPRSSSMVVSKGRFGICERSMVRPVADPTKSGVTVEANRCRCSETVLPGRLPTAMDLVKIAHLLAAVAPAEIDFLERHDQQSNRPVPHGTRDPTRRRPTRY
jgi:hypothetical protein